MKDRSERELNDFVIRRLLLEIVSCLIALYAYEMCIPSCLVVECVIVPGSDDGLRIDHVNQRTDR